MSKEKVMKDQFEIGDEVEPNIEFTVSGFLFDSNQLILAAEDSAYRLQIIYKDEYGLYPTYYQENDEEQYPPRMDIGSIRGKKLSPKHLRGYIAYIFSDYRSFEPLQPRRFKETKFKIYVPETDIYYFINPKYLNLCG